MLTFNDKPFNSKEFKKSLMVASVELVKAEIGDRFRSIRHPISGEFPTVMVFGNKLDEMSLKIEGTNKLLQHIKSKLPEEEINRVMFVERRKIVLPKVFLSFGWEDRELAEIIAKGLIRNGIDVWWAKWEISSGDSLRQKIDGGLEKCTHFIVLLSPTAIEKAWVKQEMDAGLVRMLSEKCKFIPLRYNLALDKLPPLLSGQLSPEIDEDKDVSQLVNDIHGISSKPKLGKVPIDKALPETGFSVAATAIAKVFCEASETGTTYDPSFELEQLVELTGYTLEDVEDALFELRAFVKNDHYDIGPENELFVEFDKAFKGWDPERDALRIAASIYNDKGFPTDLEKIADLFDWDCRRVNPAVNYLVNRKICCDTGVMGSHPWVQPYIEEEQSGAIRRFVKSRAE
ncbi:hypothetical protein LCGC14_0898860 [marine sediment metagenome]|uniref:TIR domain-containing protein n=1 Tax=marine sediment metagenome TaxID=412755 RepID=A0A0F9RG33_9ZZZZ